MDILVSEKDGNLICIKHKKQIDMFIMDSQVPFKDTLLCSQCFEERINVSNKIIPISKVKQIIQELSINQNQNSYSKTETLVVDLNIFSHKLMDQKNKVIQTIDSILSIIASWIKDMDSIKNQNIDLSLLQQLKQLHQDNKNEKNEEQKLYKISNAYLKNLQTNFKKLYNYDEFIQCHQHFIYILNQSQNQLNKKNNIDQVNKVVYTSIVQANEKIITHVPKQCEQINDIKQREQCFALAFNKSGSILVAGCNQDIKVWNFDKGKLTELNRLTGHTQDINCLVFSKNINWFVSGSNDSTIINWKEQQKNWISTQHQLQLPFGVQCLILNNNETELISSSTDGTITVWNVECFNNYIQFNYTLDYKHYGKIYSISLNQNETALVSCSDDQRIILWMKEQNQKWEHINEIEKQWGVSLCFVNDIQFLFQARYANQIKIFNIENKQIIEKKTLQITLKDANDCNTLFPAIYNKKRQIIISRHDKYVYIIQKQIDGNFNIVLDTIDCGSVFNYGTLSENGEYLVIWVQGIDEGFRVHQISY